MSYDPEIDMERQEISFPVASPEPFPRFDDSGIEYLERLKISEDAIDFSRLNSGASVLKNHDPFAVLGVVVRGWVENDRLFVRVRFRRNDTLSRSIFQDAVDGTLPNVSIGYEQRSVKYSFENGRRYGDVESWLPLEVSVAVGVPADSTVGFYRSRNTKKGERAMAENVEMSAEEMKSKLRELEEENAKLKKELEEATSGAETPAADEERADCAASEPERKRPVPGRRDYAGEEAAARLAPRSVARGISVRDVAGNGAEYSICNAFRELFTPGRFRAERAASDELYRSAGRAPQTGAMMLRFSGDELYRMFRRDFTAAASVGESLVGTDHRADLFVDILRLKLGVKNATVLTGLVGNQSIPRQTGESTITKASTLNDALSETNPTTDDITLSPVKYGAKTTVGKDLIAQGNPDAVKMVINDLMAMIARKIDVETFAKIESTDGVGTVEIASIASATWKDMLAFGAQIINYDMAGNPEWMMGGADLQTFKGISKDSGSGRFLCEENKIDGYNVNVVGHLASGSIYLGAWQNIIMGQWGGLEVMIDPYSLCDSGKVRVVASLLTDIAVRNPQCFVKRTAGE